MDLLDQLGTLFGIGLPGPELDRGVEGLVRDLQPAVFVLFARNLRSVSQTSDLVAGLREVAGRPVLLAVDQEGGRVSRLRDLWPDLELPTPARLGADEPETTRAFAEATGKVLRSLSLDWDLAPVVDLDRPGRPNAIGDRSFGTDPGRVVAHAEAFLDGLRAAAIRGCLKHFPGLGPTARDTHQELAVCDKAPGDLWREDLEPYRRLIHRGEPVMMGHASYPAIDGCLDMPASQSPDLVQGWLRDRLGFAGLVVTDDLEMGAVRRADDGENAHRSLVAGCDLLLFCSDGDRARRARDRLADDLRGERLPASRLREACRRVESFVGRKPSEGMETTSGPEAFRQATEMLRRICRSLA
jgi:beta-N-acetylhexosaminidase